MDLSLIIPCYNEESHLKENAVKLIQVLDSQKIFYEIIFVDDKSTDNTRDIILQICKVYSNCHFIFNSNNLGRGGAFKAGFLKSQGKVVGFIDIDLEISANYLPSFIKSIAEENFDLALGRRAVFFGFNKPIRNILSLACRQICSHALRIKSYDTQVGCKFFNRANMEEIILSANNNNWFWDTEVVYKAQIKNLKISEINVKYKPLSHKTSTVKIFPDTVCFLKELRVFRLKFGLSFSNKSPLYWSGRGYNLIMRIFFGKKNQLTFKKVSKLIPNNAEVVDVCSGTGEFYLKHLKQRECSYTGLDYNGHFVKALNNVGVKSEFFDVRFDKIPPSDYVVMVSSFYHFKNQKGEVLSNMLNSAKKAVIISEPVKNLSQHKNSFISGLAVMLTRPGEGDYRARFNLAEFKEFAHTFGAHEFYFNYEDKNAIAVFRK